MSGSDQPGSPSLAPSPLHPPQLLSPKHPDTGLHTGVRESQLQKALLRVRPKLPTEASLAAATAAATAAAAAAQEAKQKTMETAQPEQASTVLAVAKPDTQHETHSLVKTESSAQIAPPFQTDPPALAADMTQKPSSGAMPPPGTVVPAQEGPSAGAAPDLMDVDMPDVARALDSKVEPAEPAEAAEAAPSAESDKQASAELPLSDLEKSVPLLSLSCVLLDVIFSCSSLCWWRPLSISTTLPPCCSPSHR